MKNYVKIINIIDKSGSMKEMLDAAINGYNEFTMDQKRVDGNALTTTVLFSSSSRYNILYEDVNIVDSYLLTKENYVPDGMTALYDAIGNTINREIDKLGDLAPEDRPDKILCVILTDGKENDSKKFNKDQIKKLINEMRDEFKWEFIFLGADENASLTAETMGISRGNSYSFVQGSDGLRDAYAGISYATKSYRMSKSARLDNLMSDYEEEKKKDE